MEHYILSHFNTKFRWGKIAKSETPNKGLTGKEEEEWLDYRFKLFSEITYPSIINQSDKNFKWIIFFDGERTPREYIKNFDFIYPVYLYNYQYFRYIHCIEEIKKYNSKKNDLVITTRLDCDDALYFDHIKEIKELSNSDSLLINFNNGIQYEYKKNKAIQIFYSPINPFVSVSERNDILSIKTCFFINHPSLNLKFSNIKRINNSNPMWMQVVHENNISNKFKHGKIYEKNIEKLFGVKF